METSRQDLTPKLLLVGFIAGVIAVPTFHQGMFAFLHALAVTPRTAFPMQPTRPFGVPAVVSLAFWGGLWGIVLVWLARGFPRGGKGLALATLFGAIFPTLVVWLVVLPLKGQPVGGGFKPSGVATGLLVNGAWGFGTLLFAWAFLRQGAPAEQPR